MSPEPLRIRVLGALSLAPMTVRDLARCLSVRESSVRVRVRDAVRAGEACVWAQRRDPRSPRAWNVYGANW